MEFRKFSSLENTNKQRTLFAIVEQNIQGPWVITEKIDGANFSFYTDGETVRVASRTQFVDGEFFGCQEVIDRYADRVKAFHTFGQRKGTLIVHGELYGPKINRRINYGAKDFVAFDLVFIPESGEVVHCKKDMAERLCNFYGIPFVPIIAETNTVDGALQVEKSFRSILTPADFEGDNFAEGVVIEPVLPQYFANGNRVYLKNRSAEFEETASIPKQKNAAIVLPEQVQRVVDEVSQYLTENRVHNMVSKIGEVGGKDFGKLLSLVITDALVDYAKDKEVELSELIGDSEKIFNKSLSKIAVLPVRKVFMERQAA